MTSAVPVEGAQRQWSLRQRVTALCVLAAAVLTFLAGGAATTAVANRGQVDELLDSIGPMRTSSNDFERALSEEQSAARSYVLNGAAADLDRYRDAIAQEKVSAAAIAANPAATAPINDELSSIVEAAARWRETVTDPAIAARAAGDRTTAEALLNAPTETSFEQVSAMVDELQASMQVIRNTAVTSIKDTSTTLLFVLVVVVILVIAGGVALVLALQTTVVGPLTDLAAQVRRVARGGYANEIATSGPPELQRLASDVDSMRRRITADLAKVEQARLQIEQANLLLEQQAGELVRSNRDLEQFAYVASHDLQEPLRKVASFSQLLQRRYQGQLDERADEYIAFAVNGAQRMQRLINDLLAFSRIGRATTGFSTVDLNQVVAHEVAQLDLDGEPDQPRITWSGLPVINGEEPLLGTLFANLIGNALKFRRPDAVPTVVISAHRIGDMWEISCVDNGIGIGSEYAEKVFVIFQRLHAREAYPGTGIGLAIAKKIVEYHGGTIWIDTSYTNGAAIHFTVPASTGTDVGNSSVAANPGSPLALPEEQPRPDRAKEPAA